MIRASAFQPHRLGRFDVVSPLGSGGMADVYLARQAGAAGFERLFAIKRVRPQMIGDAAGVALFIREARVMQKVRHPNIVDIVELQQDEAGLYMVLEYVDGPDAGRLARALRQADRPFPWRQACHVAGSVARALAFAHAARAEDGTPLNLVHRDVSPSNILLARSGHVKLGDFGVARASMDGGEGVTQAGSLRGKLAYMPPEALMRGQVDARTDVYALGVVLWELLCGVPLWGATGADIIHKVLTAPVLPPSSARDGLPAGLDDVVMHALHRDPDQRFASARLLERAIHALVQDTTPDELAEDLASLIRDHLPLSRDQQGSAPTAGTPPITRTAHVAAPGADPHNAVTRFAPHPGAVEDGSPPDMHAEVFASAPAAAPVSVPPEDDFFGGLDAPPAAAAVTEWGAAPARCFAVDVQGTRREMEPVPLLHALADGSLARGTVGTSGSPGTTAADACQRLLLDGDHAFPVRAPVPVGVAPAHELAPWLADKSGWLTLFEPDGTPALGAWLAQGRVALVLAARGTAESGPLGAAFAALSASTVQRDSVVESVLGGGQTARRVLASLGLGDARLRQVMDARAIPLLRARAAAPVPYAFQALPTVVHDVPPATVDVGVALLGALASAAPDAF